jgi:polyhydroxyalkanoate synthase subunit PhaC
MQEKTDGARDMVQAAEGNQFETLTRNMIRLFDEGTKVISTLAERSNGDGPYSMGSEVNEAAKTLGEIAQH